MDRISKGKVTPKDTVDLAIAKVFRSASKDIPLSELGRIFTTTSFVVVDEKHIVTHHDLLNFFNENA